MTTETDLAAMARIYVRAGWSVFPLWWADCGRCACPAGTRCTSPAKHPLVRQGVNDASRDASVVAHWWARWPRANVGLPAGDNGLAILDIDPRHDGHRSLARLVDGLIEADEMMPTTLTALTGGGGLHLVFAAPSEGVKGGANVFGRNMPGLDTRGRGGYVVVPPSVHASGYPYRWVDFLAEMSPWPDALTVLMMGQRASPAKSTTAVTARTTPTLGEPGRDFLIGSLGGYAAVALRGEVARVAQAAEGERNHTLNRATFSLGQLVAIDLLDESRVADALIDAAAQCGLAGHEVTATIRSGLRGGARSPREIGEPV